MLLPLATGTSFAYKEDTAPRGLSQVRVEEGNDSQETKESDEAPEEGQISAAHEAPNYNLKS
jgi:hypothetical protein